MDEIEKRAKVEPNILIAVDGSRPALRAVDYALSMTHLIPGLRFTLLYVLPQAPPYLELESRTDQAIRRKLTKLETGNREKARKTLEMAKNRLLDSGLDPDRVDIRIRPRISGLSKDIINEAEMGRFDALVVGRRGLTRAQEMFTGSVSNQLIQHAANVPLWIVDGGNVKPNILAAVDGSSASLRAVDHVAFMLGGNPEARVAFLHVNPKLQSYCAVDFDGHEHGWNATEHDLAEMELDFRRGQGACLDDFFKKAVAVLRQAGFSQDRIVVEQRDVTMGVARTIVKAAKEGGYGAIVLGRRGLGRSSFLGSVSDKVIRRAEDLAIWLVN
ncbi:MAG: universal stress protein [Pseudomonadota bacterium]